MLFDAWPIHVDIWILQQDYALKFNDENAGVKRVDRSKSVLETADRVVGLNREITKFGANVRMVPKEVKARVLPEPEVGFQNSYAQLINGSFNLRDARFVW